MKKLLMASIILAGMMGSASADAHPIGSGEGQGVPEEQLGRGQVAVAKTESKIHQTIMMNRIGCRLQLPTTNLTLPNGVDGIQRRVIIV